MIAWREKLIATSIHFLATLALAACAATLVFLVWFPHPMATMIGGTELFMLVVGCDLALGPICSLVIFNSRKSRRALILDYTLVGLVQIAAMAYGVAVLAGTRPVYVAYDGDRLEVVTAREIADKELAEAGDPIYRSLPLTGPRLVGIDVPAADYSDALFQALSGNEEQMRPKFYVAYESRLGEIQSHAKPLDELVREKPRNKPEIEAAIRGVSIPAARLRWLPVHHRRGFWTALIDNDDGKPLAYLNLDPYPD